MIPPALLEESSLAELPFKAHAKALGELDRGTVLRKDSRENTMCVKMLKTEIDYGAAGLCRVALFPVLRVQLASEFGFTRETVGDPAHAAIPKEQPVRSAHDCELEPGSRRLVRPIDYSVNKEASFPFRALYVRVVAGVERIRSVFRHTAPIIREKIPKNQALGCKLHEDKYTAWFIVKLEIA
jgi:hypothetical protein